VDILRDAVWRHAAGSLFPEELPMVAAEALAQGADSPALRELAGLGKRSDTLEILDLYQAALEELGIPVPSTEEAVRRRLRELADGLASGRMSVVDVAEKTGPGESWMTESEFEFADLGYYWEKTVDRVGAKIVVEYEADLRAAARAVLDEARSI
jgi:hypothetical protein